MEKLSRDKLNILIELFVKKGETFMWNSKDFSRESFGAKKLMKLFPDFDFFYTLTDMQNRFKSLLGLTGKFWLPKLKDRFAQFLVDKENNKVYHMSESPIVEIKLENKPTRNVLEFIRN